MSATKAELIAESLGRELFSPLEPGGSVHAECLLDEVQIEYAAPSSGSDPREMTYVRLCWHKADRELWIDRLRVASRLRRRGIGKKLVAASEQLARRLHADRIHVFPLRPAWEFWCRLGYKPHANLARVLTKTWLSGPQSEASPMRRGGSSLRSR